MSFKELIIFLLIITLLPSFAFSLDASDPNYIAIKNKLATQDNVRIMLEVDIEKLNLSQFNKPNAKIGLTKKEQEKLEKDKIDQYKFNLNKKQNKAEKVISKNNNKPIRKGTFVPFIALEINSSNIDDILLAPDVKEIYEDEVAYVSLTDSPEQINANVSYDLGFAGQNQAIVILDSGFESAHDMLAGKIVSEACYSLDLCPGGVQATTAPGSSEACTHNSDCNHGTHVAGIALGDNGVGLRGIAYGADLIAMSVFSNTTTCGGVRLCSYASDQILALERALYLSDFYNISAVSMSLGGGSYAATCDGGANALRKAAIDNLRARGIPTIVSSGNDGYVASMGAPACISTAFSVGSVEDDDTVSGFSNSASFLDFLAPGGSIYSSVLGNGYATYAGTSMAAPHVSGAWAVLKSSNPTASIEEVEDALKTTGKLITDAKNGITTPRIDVGEAISHVIIPSFSGGSNVLNVTINEKVEEVVTYNPLKTGSGLYFDSSENQSTYKGVGTIVIKNNHPTEGVENILVDLAHAENIYNVTNVEGRAGYVLSQEEYFLYLQVPDLGPGENTTYSYNINLTKIAPPINLSTSYTNNKVMPGTKFGISDNIQNNLNSTYYNNTCIYDINVLASALDFNASGTFYNFTFDNTSIAGSDSLNAIFIDNRTLNWSVNGGSCFYPTNQTDINYLFNIPYQVDTQDDYDIINTTISYNFNDTISKLKYYRARASINLDLNFEKNMDSVLAKNNATWQITTEVSNPTDIAVNLKKVSLWVSKRNSSGTGFTNPAVVDNDTISGSSLSLSYYPHMLLNNSLNYNNSGNEWIFNYTETISPIVWMTIDNDIIDNNIQIQSSKITKSENSIYIKQIYVIQGYFLEITKNITRLSDNNYTINILVKNKGTSMTPPDQVVMVYNFLPITFNLTSNFSVTTSSWYNTQNTSEILNDPIYNGTMYQFALIATNAYNSSLNGFGGTYNSSNSWNLKYNVTGLGDFEYSDLFLTGLDPLHVDEVGSTQAVSVESTIGFVKNYYEIIFSISSILLLGLVLLS